MQNFSKHDYVEAILAIAKSDGVDIANRINHIVYAGKEITLEYFQAAARGLVKIVLNQD